MTEADVGSEECRGGGGGGARGGVLSWALLEEKVGVGWRRRRGGGTEWGGVEGGDECQLVTAQEQSTVPYRTVQHCS